MSDDFEKVRERVRASFSKQTIMSTIGATIESIEPCEVIIQLPFSDKISQQDGFVHAGVITTIVDSACGYAAMTLMPEDARVLTIEFKSNFTAPAIGEVFTAIGVVKKPGRTVMVSTGEVYAGNASNNCREQSEMGKLISLMQASMMVIKPS